MKHGTQGSITLLVIVFGAIFLGLLLALSGYVITENHAENFTGEQNQAFSIAEAGLEYYYWFLGLYPGNTTNGTGQPGPYVIQYDDPEGAVAGTYTLSVSGTTACGQATGVTVVSTGSPSNAPGVTETLVGKYAQPSVADYSYILNTNAWFASTIYGPLQSNGGIRMDGNPNAIVSSSLSSFTCDATLGCSPPRTEPGVFGAGTNQDLWEYPVPQVNFAGIAANFSTLKSDAQASGLYFPRVSSTGNPHIGYHLIFNSNGTVTVKKVTAVNTSLQSVPVDGSNGSNLTNDYSLITAETTLGTYSVPSTCGLIFVEDNVWVEGTITNKVTLVDANVTTSGVYPNAVIPNNVQYATTNGADGLTLISANDVLIGPNTPDPLTMDGIFVAQGGAFGRNLYDCNYPNYANKNTLTILGSIVSSLKPGTFWTYSGYGCFGPQTSGYANRTTSFDQQNAQNPPPFTPITTTQYQFTNWRQE